MSSVKPCDSITLLTKHPTGSLRELITLSIPITFLLLSSSLMGFIDRLFLSRLSLISFEGCVNASYLCQIFQICLSFCTTITQVFVGQCLGSKQEHKAGRYVWQMIWFSLFSMAFTIPVSHFAEKLFFTGTSIEETGTTYFRCLMWFNFLYPLGTAVSGFYFGLGRMKTVMWYTLIANAFNALLDPIFIFGIKGWIAPMNIFGAALATGISQSLFCLLILIDFLSPAYRDSYGTRNFKLNSKALWEALRIGMPRTISRFANFSAWIGIARLMTMKGGDYLLSFSLGTSIGLLFSFINDGMGQAIITVASYLTGKKEDYKIRLLIFSSLKFLLISSLLVSIPCILLPEKIIFLFLSTPPTQHEIALFKDTCFWLWIYFISFGLNYIPFALLTATGDTLFKMIYNLISAWIFSFTPTYFVMQKWGWTADKLFLVMAISSLISVTVYSLRLKMRSSRTLII